MVGPVRVLSVSTAQCLIRVSFTARPDGKVNSDEKHKRLQ